MNTFKRIAAVVFGIVILATAILPTMTYAAAEVDFTISNPYKNVNWNTTEKINYKANLHCHTWASDGKLNVDETIETHYALGYDALAITDHGTVNYSWTSDSYVKTIAALMGLVKRKELKMPTYLTDERYEEITTGVGRDGHGMIQVPYGNEQNPTSFNNAHVNTWFVDYGHGVLGGTSDYETPISNVDELGGLSVINHPGEYSSARDEDDPEKAYNDKYSYYINKYADVLKRYDSCIGIDMNSKGDGRTRNDRKLWDILIQKVAPTGRNVFGICTSDAHKKSAIDTGWIIYTTNDGNTVESFRECLETGSFFGGARNIENVKEVAILEAETGKKLADKNGQWHADQGIPQPQVKNIAIDEAEDTITIEADNALTVHWIADGEVIAVGNTIDLDDYYYQDKIGCYVRAEIFGDGGILYSQPFLLDYSGAPSAEDVRFFDWNSIWRAIKDAIIGVIKVA